MLELIRQFIDIVLHLNIHLASLTASLGPWIYVMLFAIIFCETGLIVMPFLPGDSLLFAVGAIAALPNSGVDITIVTPLLIIAAILGDAVNYKVGQIVGARVLDPHKWRWINPTHLERTEKFYNRHGGKTIIFARFIPIVRTFAPFVAGIGKMPYKKFGLFNVVGGIIWVASLCVAGYFFGNFPSVQRNFHVVIFGIIGVSFMPLVVELALNLKARRAAAKKA